MVLLIESIVTFAARNILVKDDIAKLTDISVMKLTISGNGDFKGQYPSPEMLEGLFLTPATDIW